MCITKKLAGAAGMLFFSLLMVSFWSVSGFHGSDAFAEELRMLTFQGTAPEDHLEIFKKLVKEKFGVDLTIAVTYIAKHDEIYEALRNKQTDIINCPHNLPKDSRYKFITGKLVVPIDLNNIPNYKDIIPAFQKADYITENGEVYGVPFTYAPYGLAYNTNIITEPPDSWNVLWDPKYAGKYIISSDQYEANIFITALSMGIEKGKISEFDSITPPEFLEKLKYLAKNTKSFWAGVDTAEQLQGLAFATAWGFSFSDLKNKGEIWKMANPKEGTTGGIGNFMISHTLRNNTKMKQIAEEWINYVISPDFQINVVVKRLSTAPVNIAIKDQLTPEEIEAFHLDDPDYFQKKLIPYPILDSRSRKGFQLYWEKALR